ncbi:hypothetical protein [Mucilaginibacter ginkgonis]|uniref:Uncharacterized protein n=1 Tax=Mucilaginibacter ginkgonis TaxID=2682091 RepID=A0A6I4HTW1_9SPHI|nr:hypothetical protein [Mucilaginibacter ginkgonis]QQL50362.1 hypothetical protein GO620_002585 [Mucilaginibacter ginkgonis]
MKYALLFGSNAFFVNRPIITSTLDGNEIELLKINSAYREAVNGQSATSLSVSSNVSSVNGTAIDVSENSFNQANHNVDVTTNQVHITDSHGNTVLDILQILPEAIDGLSSHVLNELHNIGEAIVIRIRGDFMVGDHHISIDNEKLFIDDDVYAESVQVGENGVEFGPNGVVI